MKRAPSTRSRGLPKRTVATSALLALLAMAPSVGNIGSCGQEAELLDAEKFFRAKATVDCNQCTECGLATPVCEDACSGAPVPEEFPFRCYPLVHDGEVCLDALRAESCDAYAGFVAPEGATIPTECNFCPLDEDGQPAPEGDEDDP